MKFQVGRVILVTLTLCQLACIAEDYVTTSEGWYVVQPVDVSPGLCHEAGLFSHAYISQALYFTPQLQITSIPSASVICWLRHVCCRQIMRPMKCTSRYHRFILLPISGIEPNPGPSLQRYPCCVCSDESERFWSKSYCLQQLRPMDP